MVKLPEFPELEFEETRHSYWLNGCRIPSVTTLMKPLSDDFYGTVDKEILERAAKRGTAIHNSAENLVKFGIEDIDPEYGGYFEAFKKWWTDKKPVPFGTERRTYHKILRYAGTSDMICAENGNLTLVDYKTSSQVNEILCGVQLEGYDRAWETHGVRIEDRVILHLDRSGCYHEYRFPRSIECWRVLSALMTIRDYKNKF